jgi:hypothetical protein
VASTVVGGASPAAGSTVAEEAAFMVVVEVADGGKNR